jgi:cell wall-associated NlpC family hydrolase
MTDDTTFLVQMQKEAVRWLGVPYLWGGEGPNQVDCSAYVRAVFRSAYRLELPRKASWQAEQGIPIALEWIRPGDLLFFGPHFGEIDHVGIYWGNGWFINATVSRGVAFSHLRESFWSGRIRSARRIPISSQIE